MPATLSRRRFISITAAAAGLALLPFEAAAAFDDAVTWHGEALGAPASLVIHHPDRALAQRLVEVVTSEVRRLERIFSLLDPDSDLVRLNRNGLLAPPPAELVDILVRSETYWRLSAGAFDPTIHPLWQLYAAHFSQADADPTGPSPASLRAALQQTDFGALEFSADRVAFARPGMGLSLNGIAQGYITDRIVELLRAAGIERSLVDMGESRAIGRRPDGSPWQVAIADPHADGSYLDVLEIDNRAVATSSRFGFQFDTAGHFNHLLDPRTGLCAHRHDSITVVAAEAASADALSTAFSLMDLDAIERAVASLDQVAVHLLTDGRHLTFASPA